MAFIGPRGEKQERDAIGRRFGARAAEPVNSKEAEMRKLLYSAISLAAAAAFATPALAQPPGYRAYDYAPAYHSRAAADFGAGVVGGTVAGLGVSEGWWGAAATAALPTTAAGAAAIGGVAGIGAVVASMRRPSRAAALLPCSISATANA